MSNIYKGQNWTLTLDTELDVSAAGTTQIRLKKPDGTTENKDASVVDNTKLKITLLSADTDQDGFWQFQSYAVIGAAIYLGKTFEFYVKDVYE